MRGQWSYDQGKQQMSTPPLRLARDAWSMVIQLRRVTDEYAPLGLGHGACSMVIRLRQATNEFARPFSRQERLVNCNTTKTSKQSVPVSKARVVNGDPTKAINKRVSRPLRLERDAWSVVIPLT